MTEEIGDPARLPAAASPGLYRGWFMVATALIGISTGPAAFGLASIGIFIGPLREQFGWSVTAISSAVTAMMLCTALFMSVAGRLVDRFGPKRVLIPSVVLFGLCLLGIALFVTELWMLIAFYIGMGTLAVGSNSIAYLRLIASWFDKSRGLAIGVASSGTGLGFAYVPLLTQYVVSEHGWRAGYMCLAAVMLCVTLPLIVFVLRDKPADIGLHVDGEAKRETTDEEGDSVLQAAGKAPFWLLLGIFASLSFVLNGLIPHLTPMLIGRGLEAAAAAAIASVFGLASFGGRVLIGSLVDRFDARRIAAIFIALSAVGIGLLAADLPPWTVLAAALLLGGTLGAEVDLLAFLLSRYFGLRCFAQIFGIVFGVVMIAMALGPVVFGAVYDQAGSYHPILGLGVPVCMAAFVLVLVLRPYAGATPLPIRRR